MMIVSPYRVPPNRALALPFVKKNCELEHFKAFTFNAINIPQNRIWRATNIQTRLIRIVINSYKHNSNLLEFSLKFSTLYMVQRKHS